MAIQDTTNDAEIRKHFRDIRDKLQSVSAKTDLVSKATIRPETSALFGNQSGIYKWLMTIFDELELLRLERISLNSRIEQLTDALEKIRAWQKKYQPMLDVIKKDHDIEKALTKKRQR